MRLSLRSLFAVAALSFACLAGPVFASSMPHHDAIVVASVGVSIDCTAPLPSPLAAYADVALSCDQISQLTVADVCLDTFSPPAVGKVSFAVPTVPSACALSEFRSPPG